MAYLKMYLQGAEQLLESLKNKPARLQKMLLGRTQRLSEMLSSYVIARNLSGQSLKVRTGVLRASVHSLPVPTGGSRITGTVRGAEGPAFYGVFHEFGSSAGYPISAKEPALSFVSGGKRRWAQKV